VSVRWKDTTSYRQGERGKVPPIEYEAEVGDARISVHRYLGLPGWFLTVRGLIEIDRDEIQTPDGDVMEDPKEAQERALHMVQEALATRLDEIERAIRALEAP
jgi:hypothetical protein